MKEMIYQSERTIDVLEDSTYKNYHYVVLSHGIYPCGYVEVPKNNKLYGIDEVKIWDDYDINCHGDITYARNYLVINNNQIYKDSWFIGWNYAHYIDYKGGMDWVSDAITKKWTTTEIVAECKSVIDQLIEHKKE